MSDAHGGRPEIWREAVPPYVLELCRQLRARQTPAEAILWEALRNRRLASFKFRRQHPLGRYVADFYCAAAALIIELDGAVHDRPEQREYDEGRQAELVGRSLTVLRLRNSDVEHNIAEALQRILAQLPEHD